MNKFLISIIVGVIIFLCIGMFLYIEIKYPNLFNTSNGLFALIASVATIFSACFAVITRHDFKKQKRAELLSEFSKEKSNSIIWIYKQLQPISEAIKLDCNTLNEENIENHNFQFLSKQLQKINKNKKIKDMCVNFTQRFEGVCKFYPKIRRCV